MLDALRIAPLPLPGGPTGMLLGAGAMGLGLTLLLFGERLGRALSTAAFGAAGAVLGGLAARGYGFSLPWLGALIGAVVFGVIGLGLPRLFWAAVLAGALAMAGLIGVLAYAAAANPADVPAPPAPEYSLTGWGLGMGKHAVRWWQFIEGRHLPLMGLGAAAGAIAGLLVGLLRPRVTRIACTAAGGAALAVSGVLIVIGAIRHGFDYWSGPGAWIVLGAMLAVAAAGMVVQYRAALRRQREKRQVPAGEAPPVLRPGASA